MGRRRWQGTQAAAAVGLYITMYAASSILTKGTKKDGESYKYNPVGVTLTVNLLKLLVSLIVLWKTEGFANLLPEVLSRGTFRFAYPGLVYLVDDNLQFAILYYLNPGEAALFYNVKVLTTALTLSLMLGKHVSRVQWSALCVLALGLASAKASSSETAIRGLGIGHLLVFAVSIMGSTGDVYNEKLLKDESEVSLHVQNIKLYLFCILFNVVVLGVWWVKTEGATVKHPPLFEGWTGRVVLLVCVNACQGLTSSAIFKFLDNLVKVQAQAAGMVLTVMLSALFFGKEPSLGFYLSVGIVANALYIYNHKGTPPPPPTPPTSARASDQRPPVFPYSPGLMHLEPQDDLSQSVASCQAPVPDT